MTTPDTIPLPDAVTRYLDAANRFDAAGASACFTPDAVVRDEEKDHAGTAAIERWVSETSLAARPQVTITSARVAGEIVHMVGTVAGNFPGSPVELDYELRLRNGKIAQLTIQ